MRNLESSVELAYRLEYGVVWETARLALRPALCAGWS